MDRRIEERGDVSGEGRGGGEVKLGERRRRKGGEEERQAR